MLKSSCVFQWFQQELSTIHGMYRFLLFLVCPSDVVFFQAWLWVLRWRLWLWQQIGTILRFRWRVQLVHYFLQPWVPLHFEMSLMPVELERKQKESSTDAQINVDKGKHVQTNPEHVYTRQRNTTKTHFLKFSLKKQQKENQNLLQICSDLRRREDRKRCRALGVARAGRETISTKMIPAPFAFRFTFLCFFFVCFFNFCNVVISWFSQAAADESVFVGAGRSEMARLGCLSL